MTEKQENILKVALQLFASNGVDGTSTSKIAKEAGVSEGLIFRHFKNKDGLLEAIMEMGNEKVGAFYVHLSSIEDPIKFLEFGFDILLDLDKEDYNFWRLMYALKWQADVYDDSMSKPMLDLYVDRLSKLGFALRLIKEGHKVYGLGRRVD